MSDARLFTWVLWFGYKQVGLRKCDGGGGGGVTNHPGSAEINETKITLLKGDEACGLWGLDIVASEKTFPFTDSCR
jgi:hypothetical protein